MKKSKIKSESFNKGENLKYYIFIAFLVLAVYANDLSNDFVFDDDSVVLGDPSITHISSIPKYFSAQEGFHKVIGRYYRPVISASYAIDYALWGPSPFGFHLTNNVIHLINSLLIFRFLFLIFNKNKNQLKRESNVYIPLIGAVIFAVHTIHTEAVTWISGRTDSLSLTFFIASFIYYLKYAEEDIKNSRKIVNFALTCFLFILALLAKEMAITLPVVIILYDILIEKFSIKQIKVRLPIYGALGLISIIYLIIRWLILKDVPQRETYFYFYGKDWFTTFLTMLQTIPLYLKLLILPVGLIYHYSGYLPYVNSFLNSEVIIAITLILLLIVIALYMVKRNPMISYSIIFFFVTLSPVLNIVPTMNFMAERFLYIPSISISLVFVCLLSNISFPKYKSYILSFSSLIILLLGYLTVMRNMDWKDNDTLFLSAEGKPGTITYVNIGNIYANKGDYNKAESYYRKAIALRDETLLANNNLGKIYMVKGNFDSAYNYIIKSISLDTLSPEPRFTLAQLYANNNMIPQAINELEKMHKIVPSYMNSRQMLADLKQKLSIDSASTQIKKSSIDERKVTLLEQESYKMYQEKNFEKAIQDLEQLIIQNPSSASAYYNNLGMCYLDQNNMKEAKKSFERSIKANDKFSTAYNNLGKVYEKMGDKNNALENYRKAIESDTNNSSAKENLERLK